jgi:heterodisulfide reductase subunit C
MNESFRKQVSGAPGGANAMACFLCGSCAAGCPVNEADNSYNPRKIMRMILSDKKDETLGSREIWKCSQCHTCVAHCPQDVRFADVLRALRGLAVSEGFASASLADKVAAIDADVQKMRLDKINAIIQ